MFSNILRIKNKSVLSFILNSIELTNEIESYLLDAINTSNSGFISEDGVVEKWVGGINKKEFTKQIKSAAKVRRKHIEKELNDKEGA